jgi:CheY-like chemotaxis protein
MPGVARLVQGTESARMSNILVIDSDPAQRASLVHALDGLGEIEHAGTGLEALRLLATKKFAIIVLDLHVRPLDGFIILRTLVAKAGPNKETPVYALAADFAERERALHEHAVFALIKPVALSTVRVLVEAGLNRPPPPSDESPLTPSVATIPPPRSASVPPSQSVPPNGPPSTPPPSLAASKTSVSPPDRARATPPPSPSRPGLGPDKPTP